MYIYKHRCAPLYINVYLYETGGEEYGLDTMWHLLNSNIYMCVTQVVFLSCACVWILKIIMCIYKNVWAWQHVASVLPKQATQWPNTKRVGGQWTRKEQIHNKMLEVLIKLGLGSLDLFHCQDAKMSRSERVKWKFYNIKKWQWRNNIRNKIFAIALVACYLHGLFFLS